MNKINYYYDFVKNIRSVYTIPKCINYLRYRLSKLTPIVPLTRYTPQMVAVIMTNRCNLRCSFCGNSKFVKYNTSTPTLDMSLGAIKKLFEHPLLRNALSVDLGGGEPLLVDDVEKIVSFLSHRGHIVSLTTNGMLLHKHIEGLKKAGVSRINVSIYPTNRKKLSETLPEVNAVFRVNTSLLLTKSQLKNPDDIMNIIEFAKDTNCKGLQIKPYRLIGLNADNNEVFDVNLDDDYRALYNRAMEHFHDFLFAPKPFLSGGGGGLLPSIVATYCTA